MTTGVAARTAGDAERLLVVTGLTTDALVDPLGTGSPQPTFAWCITSDQTDVLQRSYEIEVTSDAGEVVWSSQAESDLPFDVRYRGAPLLSSTRYRWRVRVQASVGSDPDEPGSGRVVRSEWSEAAHFETALLDPTRWRASWIAGPSPTSKVDDTVHYFRKHVRLPAGVVRARAYVSSLGWNRFFVNGTDLTGPALVPRYTPYDHVIEHQTYDVTTALREGDNVVALVVADGRYRGALGLLNARAAYGDRTAGLVQIEVDLADGTRTSILSDGSWSTGPGRITGADPKRGERIDLRVSDDDWLTDDLTPSRFRAAEVLQEHHRLVAESVERVCEVQRIPATAVLRSPSGQQIVDFGQNFAGVVRIRVDGPRGAQVQLTHGEVLTPEGELDTASFVKPAKQWYQRDTITLDGTAQWVQPWFTIHGFRYVEVSGLEADLDPADVVGVVLSSALSEVGTFEASDARLEQLRRNVLWSVRSNYTDTPTDCPTRERAGWTGDIQVFAPAGSVLVQSHAFLRRYLDNLVMEQYEDGAVPIYVPKDGPRPKGLGGLAAHGMARSVGWADAAVLLPWTVYERYGDTSVLERQYPSMKLWLGHQVRQAAKAGRGRPARTLSREGRKHERYVVDRGFHFGEWLRPGENALTSIRGNLVRPPASIATAYFAHSARTLARAAEVLGELEDAARFNTLAERIREAWRFAFVRPDGRVASDRQDDYVRALAFDLLEPSQRPAAVARLVELVEQAGDHLTTGFLSTPMLLPQLVEGGRSDVAVRLLMQTSNPSWLHQVEAGATTTWETWEGFDSAGRAKESHNHYALGAVAGWLTEGLAGLALAAPGYRRLRIAPVVTRQLDSAGATLQTPFGLAASRWRREGGEVVLEVVVPAGSSAEVVVPGDDSPRSVGSGTHVITWPEERS